MNNTEDEDRLRDLEELEKLTRMTTVSPLPENLMNLSLGSLTKIPNNTVRPEKLIAFNKMLGMKRLDTPGECIASLAVMVRDKVLTENEATSCMLIVDLAVAHKMTVSDITFDDNMDKTGLM